MIYLNDREIQNNTTKHHDLNFPIGLNKPKN